MNKRDDGCAYLVVIVCILLLGCASAERSRFKIELTNANDRIKALEAKIEMYKDELNHKK